MTEPDVRYLALLRGINVGRAKRIAMADLRQVLGGLGYRDVATYLHSGNAVFSTAASAETVATAVQDVVRRQLGVDSAVVVRTERQLTAAIDADPFGEVADDPARHLLGFFSASPPPGRLAAFRRVLDAADPDPAVAGLQEIAGDHCYLWCPHGISKSPFATVDWHRGLGVVVTMRNFSTVLRLAEMLRG